MFHEVTEALSGQSGSTWVPLTRAAALAGKSDRQIRYLIQTQRIHAIKESGRWLVRPEDLAGFELDADFVEIGPAAVSTLSQSGASREPCRSGYGWQVSVSRPGGPVLKIEIPQPQPETAQWLLDAFLRG